MQCKLNDCVPRKPVRQGECFLLFLLVSVVIPVYLRLIIRGLHHCAGTWYTATHWTT